MISFKQQDSKIIVNIDTKYPVSSYHIPFEWTAPSKFWAALLIDNLNENLRNKIRHIRVDEYNKGYKDGRNKQKKEDWFSSQF